MMIVKYSIKHYEFTKFTYNSIGTVRQEDTHLILKGQVVIAVLISVLNQTSQTEKGGVMVLEVAQALDDPIPLDLMHIESRLDYQ